MQAKCNEVIDLLVSGGVFPSIKFILYKMGIIRTPHCRRPLGAVKDSCLVDLSRVATALLREFKELQFETAG
jgi:N-acetylneuraminate lyase